jgi:hypothetical protein
MLHLYDGVGSPGVDWAGAIMAPVVLDIETVPLIASLEMPYPEGERMPPANYKSDEAVAKWREADVTAWRADRVKACSLNPRLGRVFCVGLKSGPLEQVVVAKTELREARALATVWEVIADADGRVVTWNGSWDLRFLLIRSMLLKVPVPIRPATVRGWLRKYSTHPHCDVKAMLTNWEAPVRGEGLNEWAQAFGVGGKTDGLSGASVWPMFARGEFDAIAAYCLDDVRATAALYEAAGPVLDLDFETTAVQP